MASIVGAATAQVKSRLDAYLSAEQIEEACRRAGHRWRDRLLGPANTVHLFLLQLLAGVAMAGMRHVANVNTSAQAFCKAKMRLPLSALTHLIERNASSSCSCWKGRPVVIVDGTSFQTPDTPALSGRYGRASNGKGRSRSYPVPKLLAALDLHTGLLLKVIALPWHRQERTCLTRLFQAVAAGAVLLADRGLAGFAQLALTQAAGVNALIRLPRWLTVFGRGKGAHRRVGRLGKQDQLVSWRRDKGLRRPTWMSKRRWSALPQELTLRQVAFRIVRKGHRTRWAWLITTLTDAAAYPAEDLVALYAKRWQVEVCFRDLKQTLGLKRLSARTVAGIRKELLAFVLLYNLVRRVMLEAAGRQRVSPQRVSFTDAVRWLLWSSPGEDLPTLRVNPPRPGRATQPRMLKSARKRYTQLNRPREQLIKSACEAKL